MHDARKAPELPRRGPGELCGASTAFLLITAVSLLGCSSPSLGRFGPVSLGHLAPESLGRLAPVNLGLPAWAWPGEDPVEEIEAEAGPEDPTLTGRWVGLSRAGREAMQPGHYDEAERQFLAALAALDAQSPGDARIRATLGNLVRLAAIYQRLERASDAERVLLAISDHAETRGTTRLRRGVPYDSRYHILVDRPLPLAFSGVSRGSGVSRKKLDALIARTARSYHVDPALVKAVVAAESNFEPLAVSHAGAQGLMQLMPQTAEEMGVLAPFRPSDNLRGGVRYLRQMLDRYGDLSEALAAYNAGPNAVDRHGGIPPYPETREYVKRVLNFYHDYQGQITR